MKYDAEAIAGEMGIAFYDAAMVTNSAVMRFRTLDRNTLLSVSGRHGPDQVLVIAEDERSGPSPVGSLKPDVALMEQAVGAGLPFAVLHSLARALAAEPGQAESVAQRLADAETKASPGTTLSAEASARAERVARLFVDSEQTLGSRQDARAFLMHPHLELEGRAPIDVAATELGARRVERILASIAYGLPV